MVRADFDHLGQRPQNRRFDVGQQRLERSTQMDFDHARAIAAKNLTTGATLDELRQAARDLRALSPDSALAELVEAKIERLLSGRNNRDVEGEGEQRPDSMALRVSR